MVEVLKIRFSFRKIFNTFYHNKFSLLAIFRRQATLKMKKNMINQMKKMDFEGPLPAVDTLNCINYQKFSYEPA